MLQRHLPGLAALPGVEITAVCNSTFESTKAFCDEHLPHATPMKNWADLLMLSELDIVWIGTPPYMHSTVAISAMEADRHVFCQARMGMGLEDAQEMLDAAKDRPDLVTMLCPPPHGMKAGAAFKKLIASGKIGTPHQLHLRSMSPAFLDADAPAHWRQRKELSGLNVLTLGIYAEVLQEWFSPISALSAHGRVVNPIRAGYKVEVPDFVSVLCEFNDGVLGTLEFSSVASHAGGDQLTVHGSNGVAIYDFDKDTIHVGTQGDGCVSEVHVPLNETVSWTVERDFIAAVRNPKGPRPHPDFKDGLSYMRVVQAVADSMASGRRIPTGN